MSGLVEFVGNTIKTHRETIQEDSPRDFIDIYLTEMQKTTDPGSSFYGSSAGKMGNIFKFAQILLESIKNSLM